MVCARTVAACTGLTALCRDCFRDKEPVDHSHHHHRTIHRQVVEDITSSDSSSCSDDSLKRNHSTDGYPLSPRYQARQTGA